MMLVDWNNTDEVTLYKHRWYLGHREEYIAKAVRWAKENREKRRKIEKRYLDKNKGERYKYLSEYRKNNRDKINAIRKRLYQNNEESRKNNLDGQRRHHDKSKFNGLRERRLEMDNYMCQNCDSQKKIHVHHKKYGDTIAIEDLVTLCASCHMGLHHRKEEN